MAKQKSKLMGLSEVLDYKPSNHLVISMYLLVDSTRVLKKDYLTKLNSMITESRENIESDLKIEKAQKKNIYNLLEKIKKYVNDKFMANSTRALLVYAGENGLWNVLRLPVILRSKIVIDPKPHTQSLRTLLENSKKYGVLLINREKAQIYSIYIGEIEEYLAAFISEVPSKVNFRRQAAFREKKILSRIEEKLHHFFKSVNDRTLELFREGKFDNLILAGRKDILPQFANYLHSYLQSKCIGSIYAEPDSSESFIKEKAQEIIGSFEIETKNNLVNKLFDEYNPNGWGVLGIEAVISSLLVEQIRTIIYDRYFKQEGYICNSCKYITIKSKDRCPYCKSDLIHYNDIVDEIVEDALNQNCEVIDIKGNEKLNKAGSIGAVLRYKL